MHSNGIQHVMFMNLYVQRNVHSWNSIVKASPYAVAHHEYEVLTFDKHKRTLPLVFEEGKNRLLFPLRLENFLGLRTASVPVYDLASVLPNSPQAIHLVPEALDSVQNFLRQVGVVFLTVSAPFLLPKECLHLVDVWFEKKNALVQPVFVDALHMQRKTFEEIWMNDFSKHARNRTRKAKKEGVVVREIEVFENWISHMHLCNMSSFHRQGRYPRYPHSNRDAFLVYLNRHRQLLGANYKVYGAFLGNRLIAYMATLEYKRLVLISLIMSLSEFLSKCPNDALLKHLVDHACQNDFEWIYYSFDRVRYGSDRASLHFSLRRFKFEHGFKEYPMHIYHLGLTKTGAVLQRFTSFYNFVFVTSSYLPHLMTDAIQKIYEKRRYKKSKYSYISEFLNQRKTI